MKQSELILVRPVTISDDRRAENEENLPQLGKCLFQGLPDFWNKLGRLKRGVKPHRAGPPVRLGWVSVKCEVEQADMSAVISCFEMVEEIRRRHKRSRVLPVVAFGVENVEEVVFRVEVKDPMGVGDWLGFDLPGFDESARKVYAIEQQCFMPSFPVDAHQLADGFDTANFSDELLAIWRVDVALDDVAAFGFVEWCEHHLDDSLAL